MCNNKIHKHDELQKCLLSLFRISLLFTANIVVLGQGCAIGWLSPTLPLLQSDDSPLQSGKLTIEEASWIGSISSIGSVVGTIYFGLMSIYFGCKKTLVFCGFPVAVRIDSQYRDWSSLFVAFHGTDFSIMQNFPDILAICNICYKCLAFMCGKIYSRTDRWSIYLCSVIFGGNCQRKVRRTLLVIF